MGEREREGKRREERKEGESEGRKEERRELTCLESASRKNEDHRCLLPQC
jgi:hypothetical protein